MLRLFLDFMERGGGTLMWAIYVVSIVIWTIGIRRWAFLSTVFRARARFLALCGLPRTGRPQVRSTGLREYDDLLADIAAADEMTPDRAVTRFRRFLICIVPRINRGFPAMAAWISVAPLLGLLGTVMGMIETFRVITAFGVGNPALTAEGISVALLTTQAGLTVAFPGVVLQNFLANRRASLMAKLMRDGEEMVKRAGAEERNRAHV